MFLTYAQSLLAPGRFTMSPALIAEITMAAACISWLGGAVQ
jgi:hypothetical protein